MSHGTAVMAVRANMRMLATRGRHIGGRSGLSRQRMASITASVATEMNDNGSRASTPARAKANVAATTCCIAATRREAARSWLRKPAGSTIAAIAP